MKIYLEGDFDLIDLHHFAQALRIAEKKQTDKLFTMIFDDGKMTVDEAKRFVRMIYDATLEASG